MSRSTIKQQNEILDRVKSFFDLKSRKDASNYLYSVVNKHFNRYGYDLSHYKDGSITATKDHLKFHYLSCADLDTPATTCNMLDNK